MIKHFSKLMLTALFVATGICLSSCSDQKDTDEPIISNEPIFTSDFDKEAATMSYGSKGKSWPYMEEFEGWINHLGNGSEKVSYTGQKISIRTNQSSKGDLSQYEGSGVNNIFFSTAPNFFTINDIKVNSRNLHLCFGAQRYAQGASNDFLKSDFEIRVSADKQTWSQPLTYSFSKEDVPGTWRKADMDFTLPEGVGEISIRFVAKMSSVNRLDDVLLTQGRGGQEVVFGGDETIRVSSIKEVLAGEIDHIYRIKGQIIGTHDKGFLVKDETGIILVFKKKHGMVTGSTVEIQGATTTYGGMKQFGETSEITFVADGTYNQPAPEVFDGSRFDEYMKNPSIRYIQYEGVMTSYRDDIWQWHNNVTVAGTDVLGAIMYPARSINIQQFENKHVKVTGYAIGGKETADGKKLLNTMVIGMEEVK